MSALFEVPTVANTLAALSLLAGASAVLCFGLLSVPAGRARLARELAGEDRVLLGVAWLAAAVSTGGSLYFSQVAGFIPCVLCWYQRIAMYPLVLILAVAWWGADTRAWRYVLPVAGTGLAVSLYHIAVQNRPALDAGTCSAEAPCTVRYVSAFGFASIPVMAAGGFLVIGALVLAAAAASAREVPGAGAGPGDGPGEGEGAEGPLATGAKERAEAGASPDVT